jgi:D-sedoheptulose 7-phosphate isomerase
MSDQHIQQHIIDSADGLYQTAEPLAKQVDAAAQTLVTSLTSGGKVLVAGSGGGAWLGPYLVQLLINGLERERPPLPAVYLAPSQGELDRQLQAMGHAGDVLVLISDGTDTQNLTAWVQSAHERDISVVALTGPVSSAWSRTLAETDVHVVVAHEPLTRVREVQCLVLHCLCDAIDVQLLGEQEKDE